MRLGLSASDGSVFRRGQGVGELRARAQVELAKDAAEMRLDRAQGDKQRLRDLAIAEARSYVSQSRRARGSRSLLAVLTSDHSNEPALRVRLERHEGGYWRARIVLAGM
jgi:hypothetical protein